MITISSNVVGQRVPFEFFGLSKDEKPIGKVNGVRITNGSMFYEMDTKKVFAYDEEAGQWLEQ